MWQHRLDGLTFDQLRRLYEVGRDCIDDEVGLPKLLGQQLVEFGIKPEAWPDQLQRAMIVDPQGMKHNWLLEQVVLELLLELERRASDYLGFNAWLLANQLAQYRETLNDRILADSAVVVHRATLAFEIWEICQAFGGIVRVSPWLRETLSPDSHERLSCSVVLRELAAAVLGLGQLGLRQPDQRVPLVEFREAI